MTTWLKIKNQHGRRIRRKTSDGVVHFFYASDPMGTPASKKHAEELLKMPDIEEVNRKMHKERRAYLESKQIDEAVKKLPEEVKLRVDKAIKSSSKRR